MKLTDFQMRRIYDMAVNAYEYSKQAKESDAAYIRFEKECYGIYQALDILADKQLRTSEGHDIVLSNGVGKEPTMESIANFLAPL